MFTWIFTTLAFCKSEGKTLFKHMLASFQYESLFNTANHKVLNKVFSFPLHHFHSGKKNKRMEINYNIVENMLNVINKHI